MFWFPVPKVASKSIQSLGEPAQSNGGGGYAVVRDPRERFASAFNFYQTNGRLTFTRGEMDFVTVDETTTPEQMMDLVEADHLDRHFSRQVSFFPLGTRLYQMEGSTWKKLLNPPHFNQREHPSAAEWFSDDILRRIDNYYRVDRELWEQAYG